ncbi:MAG: hypothetical protein DRO40_01985 [Thermoprotei archaeon]|nr:MAG: hypothetical protein DRO40_01985 [Thermoprotei archaeon]
MFRPLIALIILMLTASSITVASNTPHIYYKVSYSIEVDNKVFEKEFFVIFYPLNNSIVINNTLLSQTTIEIKEYGIKIDLVNEEKEGEVIRDFTIQVDERLEKFDVLHIIQKYRPYFIELYYELSSGILIQADIYDLEEEATPIGIIFLYNYTVTLNKIYTQSTSPLNTSSIIISNTKTNTSPTNNQDQSFAAILPIVLSLTIIFVVFTILYYLKRQ